MKTISNMLSACAARLLLFIGGWLARIDAVFSAVRRVLYDDVIAPYKDCVCCIDVVSLAATGTQTSKPTRVYRASIFALYIDRIIQRITGTAGTIYKPCWIFDASHCDFLQPELPEVLMQRTWRGKCHIALCGGNTAERARHGLEWTKGRVLNARVICESCWLDVTDTFAKLGAGVGALTPRELVLLLFQCDCLRAHEVVCMLKHRDVSITLLLDDTLEELTAGDGEPIASAS